MQHNINLSSMIEKLPIKERDIYACIGIYLSVYINKHVITYFL